MRINPSQTGDNKNVLLLTKENLIRNEESMRKQHPLFSLASDWRELNDSLQDGGICHGYIVSRPQPISETTEEAWDISYLTFFICQPFTDQIVKQSLVALHWISTFVNVTPRHGLHL